MRLTKALCLLLTVNTSRLSNSEEQTCTAADPDTCSSSSSQVPPSKSSSLQSVTYKPTCSLYLAESSIPNAGFGIYTTVPLKEKEKVTEVADAPSLVVTDTELHASVLGYENSDAMPWNYNNYFWDGSGQGEFEAHEVMENVMNLGALCNYHTYFKNVKPWEGPKYNDAMTNRNGGSPGMGAYSYQPGFLFRATREIDAGEELFCDYGEEWLDTRLFGGDVLREDDFYQAGNILQEIKDGLSETEITDGVLKVMQGVVKHFDKRVSQAIPTSREDFDDTVEEADDQNDIADFLAQDTIQDRSIDWIQTNGVCLDHLVPQVSTLPDAGQGAFAQRFIPKGDIIVPMPMIMIMGKDLLDIYEFEIDEDDKPILIESENSEGEKIYTESSKQLLYNYCFSHEDTSMMMCPQTNGILINHCSDRKAWAGDCAKYNANPDKSLRGPNAKLEWGTKWDPDTQDWLKLTPDEIKQKVMQGKRGLSFQVVATRDIQPGQEVFIDYGEAWENDWEKHIQEFVPPLPSDDFVPIFEMNKNKEKYLTAEDDLEEHPYPMNAALGCIYWPREDEAIDEKSPLDGDNTNWTSDGSIYTLDHPDYAIYGLVWPCGVDDIFEDEDGNKSYNIEIYSKDGMTIWAVNDKRRILEDYPIESIAFVPQKYTSDQHLIGSFRSNIRIPEELLPDQWRNVGDDEEEFDADE